MKESGWRIRFHHVVLPCLLAMPVGAAPQSTISEPPWWAYPVPSPNFKPAPDDGTIRKVPDSSAGFTLTQLRDRYLAPDWHPREHLKLPEIVAHGRKPDVYACGFCHRADGPGGPENANLAGLPYAYIVQQMADFKNGTRSTALSQRLPQSLMVALAKATSDAEIEEAARYFSSLRPRQNIRVVETDRVPKTYVASWILALKEGKETEPLGDRIVETPENLEQFESRDTHSTFVVFAPKGSIGKGAALVNGEKTDKAPACTTCHGQNLRGHDAVPPIAGRSPSYVVRQLYDMKSKARAGKGAALMKSPVANLGPDDMISIAAYLASLKP
jgi:cytochrome c553